MCCAVLCWWLRRCVFDLQAGLEDSSNAPALSGRKKADYPATSRRVLDGTPGGIFGSVETEEKGDNGEYTAYVPSSIENRG